MPLLQEAVGPKRAGGLTEDPSITSARIKEIGMLALKLKAEDTVATVLQETKGGDRLEVVMKGSPVGELVAREDIPYGFKIAAAPMSAGADVVKYGHVIGRASRAIEAGELVHVHNIEGCRGRGDLAAKEG